MRREILLSQHSHYTNIQDACPENNFSEGTKQAVCYEYVWTVLPSTTPKIIRRCPRCDRDRFYSSDKFRINANKKIIDVWLIYKCVNCDFTHNLPIITRKPVSKIDGKLFTRLQENDAALCWQYAFDAGIFQKGMQIDWDIDIAIQERSLQNEVVVDDCKVQILIQSEFILKIPIFSVLRAKMQLSRNLLEKLQKNEELEVFRQNGDPLNLKAALGQGCILRVSSRVVL